MVRFSHLVICIMMTLFTSRPSYVSNPWLKPDEHQSNFLTGRELLIANRFPVIVHEASVTNKLEQLFNIVGRKFHHILINLKIKKHMKA